jgi:hypothetical protein
VRHSLQEQLIKAGLVDEKKLNQAQHGKKKEQRQGKTSQEEQDRQRAQKAAAEKAARDKQLNAEREAQAAQKALYAELRQIIANGRHVKNDGDVVYNFVDGGKVKRLYMTEPTRQELVRGTLAIVRLRNHYDIVSVETAEAVAARLPQSLIVLNKDGSEQPAADDPYADHPIPDDLMW